MKIKQINMVILLCAWLCADFLCAQSLPFQGGEELNFDIDYKYGLVMIKAGTAKFGINEVQFQNKPAYRSSLLFKTTSFFDNIQKVRDSLYSYVNTTDLAPLYHFRTVHEGDYHYTEKIYPHKCSDTYSEARLLSEKYSEIRYDTVLYCNNLGYDILNVFLFIRTQDYTQLKLGDNFRITIFMGKELVNMIVRYQGQSILERNSNTKYNTHKFNVDIVDKAFKESKNAMEVWISDDANRIPVKLRAKLKIGAAEAHLSSYRNLKNPFTAEIKIP